MLLFVKTVAILRQVFENFLGKHFLLANCSPVATDRHDFLKIARLLNFRSTFLFRKFVLNAKIFLLNSHLKKLASISKEGCKPIHFSSVPKIEIWLRQGYTLLIWVIFFRKGGNINTLFIKKTVMENFDIKPSPAHFLLKQLKNLYCVTAKPK